MKACDQCDLQFPTNTKLKRHQANAHGTGVVWHYCDYVNELGIKCKTRCKDKYNLKKHKAACHNIDVKYYPCDQDGCNLVFKTNSDFKRHQSAVHNINVKWFNCDYCKSRFKTKSNLDRHFRAKHEGEKVFYHCNIDECDFRADTKGQVQQHQREKHHVNARVYHCSEEGCTYNSTSSTNLKSHLGYIHDIGNKRCNVCFGNRYTLKTIKDNTGIPIQCCQTCVSKITSKKGSNSRIEIIMSDYLDEHFGTEFLIASDNRIYGESCQRYRPDKMYASPKTVLHIECDERQHVYANSNYSCDEKRISDIYDEFPGKKYIVIRWNPDAYVLPADREPCSKITARSEKLALLLKTIKHVLKKPPTNQIHIIYMFYNENSPLISKNIQYTMVYNQDDLEFL